MITYDCKKTIVEWQKSCDQECWQITAVDLEKKAIIRSVVIAIFTQMDNPSSKSVKIDR